MFVVAGVNGHTGSVVADTLLTRGQKLRVIVRDAARGQAWRAKGADVAVGSLDDRAALARAFAGTDGAYVLLPPDLAAERFLDERRRMADAIAAAVRDSDLQHIVFLSSIGAHLPQGTGPILALRHGEEALQAVMDALTILRAPFFMENWLPVLPVAKAHGVLPSFISPDRQIPMIATTDIGHLAAECLMDQATGVRVLELVGPKPYSPRDVAAAASKQFGRTVTVQHLPLEQVVPQLTSFGISRHMATLFADMYAAIETGRLVHEGRQGCCQPRGLVTLEEALFGSIVAPAA